MQVVEAAAQLLEGFVFLFFHPMRQLVEGRSNFLRPIQQERGNHLHAVGPGHE